MPNAYAITVTFGDPTGDNAVLLEALDIMNAKRLPDLRGWQYIAHTPYELRRVHDFLIKHSRDDHGIIVKMLRQPATPNSAAPAESRRGIRNTPGKEQTAS